MIICNTQIDNIRYGIWHLTESISELNSLINGRFEVSLTGISNPTRQKERLASRLLIEALCGKFQPVGYRANGEPYFLDSNLHLSISHTKNYVAVAIAPCRIGIDIEHLSDRVLRITEKFLNQEELKTLAKTNNQAATALLFWCAKETLYKKLSTDEPNFIYFTCKRENDLLSVHYQGQTYPLYFIQDKDYTLVVG
jgi:phosphopantetheinyl transferase